MTRNPHQGTVCMNKKEVEELINMLRERQEKQKNPSFDKDDFIKNEEEYFQQITAPSEDLPEEKRYEFDI